MLIILFLLLSRNGKERRRKKGNDDKENEHPASPFSVVETNRQQIASFFSASPTQFLCMCVCIYKRHRDTSSQRTEINNNMLLLPLLPLVSPYSSTSSHRSRQLSTRPSLAYTCDTVFCECMYFRDFPEQKKVDRSRGG
jgi:hypothetical protein